MRNLRYIVLDLDDTLVTQNCPCSDLPRRNIDGSIFLFRPGLREFFDTLINKGGFSMDQFVIWSAGGLVHVQRGVRALEEEFNIKFYHVYSVESTCEVELPLTGYPYQFKNLRDFCHKVLDCNMDEVLMVDDNPILSAIYPRHVYQIPALRDTLDDDDELYKLTDYIFQC